MNDSLFDNNNLRCFERMSSIAKARDELRMYMKNNGYSVGNVKRACYKEYPVKRVMGEDNEII